MELEPITRQEKIIAGQDLEPITRMEKFLKDFSGGGVTSWNDLTDKPFGENNDGIIISLTEPLDTIVFNNIEFIKISDAKLSLADITGAKWTYQHINTSTTREQTFTAEFLNMYGATEDCLMFDDLSSIIVFADSFTIVEGFTLGRGVWVDKAAYTKWTLTKDPTIKTIDMKYLPEQILTSPNGTQYKITVDDSGTISATEV